MSSITTATTAVRRKQACTNCGRCKAACPAGLDIPTIIKGEIKPFSDFTGPEDCIECGACTACCPEKIAVKDLMRELAMKQCRQGRCPA